MKKLKEKIIIFNISESRIEAKIGPLILETKVSDTRNGILKEDSIFVFLNNIKTKFGGYKKCRIFYDSPNCVIGKIVSSELSGKKTLFGDSNLISEKIITTEIQKKINQEYSVETHYYFGYREIQNQCFLYAAYKKNEVDKIVNLFSQLKYNILSLNVPLDRILDK